MIHSAYSSSTFVEASRRLVERLARHFDTSTESGSGVFRWKNPDDLRKLAEREMKRGRPLEDPAKIAARVDELAALYLDGTQRLHSPGYVGHQVPPPPPIAGLFEAIGSATNQPSGIYEMGPFPSAVERAMMFRLGAYLGWKPGKFDGFATHGGSAANLTALLAARNAAIPGAWRAGVDAGRPVMFASEDAHYSVARAAGIMGIGAHSVYKIPVAPGTRGMDPGALERTVMNAIDNGELPVAIVGSACSTPIGAFDPLHDLADIARQHRVWFHVDAAHGGGILLSEKHRHLLDGIERADSVVWDAHKMMFVPALCTFVFFKDPKKSYEVFDQDAPYLFDPDAHPNRDYDSALRTLECTKRPVAMALWMLWSTFGPGLFAELVDRSIDRTRELHSLVAAAEDFEPLHEPACNILCFRYKPAGEAQFALRARIVRDGNFYLTQAKVGGREALRVTILNPFVSSADLEALLQEIRRHG